LQAVISGALVASNQWHPSCDEHVVIRIGSKAATARYVDLVTGRAKRVIDGCGFTFWTDISATKVLTFLADLRADVADAKGNVTRGLSAQTSNFYTGALKQFARWMVRDGRADQDPVAYLDGLNVRTDRRHDRRALTLDEVRVAAAYSKHRRQDVLPLRPDTAAALRNE